MCSEEVVSVLDHRVGDGLLTGSQKLALVPDLQIDGQTLRWPRHQESIVLSQWYPYRAESGQHTQLVRLDQANVETRRQVVGRRVAATQGRGGQGGEDHNGGEHDVRVIAKGVEIRGKQVDGREEEDNRKEEEWKETKPGMASTLGQC